MRAPPLVTVLSCPTALPGLPLPCSNGPDALKNYSGDKDVVEAAMEAGDIIQQLQQEQQVSQQQGHTWMGAQRTAPQVHTGAIA